MKREEDDMRDSKLERMQAEILSLWQEIRDAREEDRPALRSRYARAYEHYRAHRDEDCAEDDALHALQD